MEEKPACGVSSFLVYWSGLNTLNAFFSHDSQKEALSTSYLSSSSPTSKPVSLQPGGSEDTPIAYL